MRDVQAFCMVQTKTLVDIVRESKQDNKKTIKVGLPRLQHEAYRLCLFSDFWLTGLCLFLKFYSIAALIFPTLIPRVMS